MTPVLAAFQPAGDALARVTVVDGMRATFEDPLWVDVEPHADSVALADELATLGGHADPELVARFLGDARAATTDAPAADQAARPDDAAAQRLWAFGSTAALQSRDDPYVDLQPVTIVVTGGLVVTCRHRGLRYSVGTSAPADDGEPIDLERLVREATIIWQAKEAGDRGDRDLLLFAILNGLVATHFVTRAELGQEKARIDWRFFDELSLVRRRAATWQPSVNEVAEVAVLASSLIDDTRARLVAIQELVVEFRQWFDRLKPPGRLNKATIWLRESPRRAESERLVDEIYRVRNDLRGVRQDVHASMALLASADTGGQLLAIRALLDRTESARRAVIVAGTLTVILASAALAAGLAAVPAGSARFAIAQAAAAAAVVAVLAVFAGVAVAVAAGRSSGMHSARAANALALALASAAAAAFVFALAAPEAAGVALLGAGTGLALLAIGVFAYFGDFGGGRIPQADIAALERFMRRRGRWSGSPDELARRLRGRWPFRRATPADGATLLACLEENGALLRSLGITVADDGALTVTRAEAPPRA